jgi:hypothetical protein
MKNCQVHKFSSNVAELTNRERAQYNSKTSNRRTNVKYHTTRKFYFVAAFAAGIVTLSLMGISSADAQEYRRYRSITPQSFHNCIKNTKGGGGWTEYTGGNSGEVTIRTDFFNAGVAKLHYTFVPVQGLLTYQLGQQWLGTRQQLCQGFDNTVNKCR